MSSNKQLQKPRETSSLLSVDQQNIAKLNSQFEKLLQKAVMVESEKAEMRISESSVNQDFATPEKQEARTFLRERFLRVISGVIGEEASFQMYENTKVKAEFRGCDIDCLEIFTRNLETPSGKVPEAILRATDVISIEIDHIRQQT